MRWTVGINQNLTRYLGKNGFMVRISVLNCNTVSSYDKLVTPLRISHGGQIMLYKRGEGKKDPTAATATAIVTRLPVPFILVVV